MTRETIIISTHFECPCCNYISDVPVPCPEHGRLVMVQLVEERNELGD